MNVGRRYSKCHLIAVLLIGAGAVETSDAAQHAADKPLDPETARLTAEALQALDEGFYSKAGEAASEALRRTEAASGAGSPETAEALDLWVRALANGAGARDPKSLQAAERAVDLKRRLYGSDDARYAASLHNQAVLLVQSGSPGDALELFDRALRTTEAARGPHDPQVATILSGYADAQRQVGDYEMSMAGLERALEIFDAAGDPDTLQVTMVMNRLGLAHSDTGDYVKARDYLERAIALREAHYGKDHPRVTGLVNNLAQIYDETGDEATALQLFQQVLDSLNRTLDDPDDVRIGAARLNVAVATRVGDPRAAEPLYEEALAGFRKRLGGDHELVAKCLLGLGAVHRSIGELEESMSYYRQALDVFERTLPPGHPQIALTLRHMAAVQFESGRLDAARATSDRTLEMTVTSLGDEHPEVAEVLALRGAVLAASGDRTGAIESSLQAETIGASHLRLMARGFAERDALVYARSRPRGLDVPLQLVAEGLDPAIGRRVWDVEVRSRSLVLDEMVARSRSVTVSKDPEVRKLVADLRRETMRVTRLVVGGPGDDPERHATEVAAARRDKEAAERALAAKSTAFSQALAEDAIGLEEVAANRPTGSALVAFVAYERTFVTGAERGPNQQRESQLLAFVLDPAGGIDAVPIGPSSEVEALVARWSREAARGALLPERTPEEALAAYLAAGDALRRVVWDPVARRIGDPCQVFVVSEGVLHTVSFVTLPIGSDRYLIDVGWRFHYLATERDLVPASRAVERGRGLLAVGDVDFDAPRAPEVGNAAGGNAVSPPAMERGAPRTSRGDATVAARDDLPFDPLPGTAQEARDVIVIWEDARPGPFESDRDRRTITLLTGAKATEGAFKSSAAGKRVLHIATHGFFADRRLEASSTVTRGLHPVAPRPQAPAQRVSPGTPSPPLGAMSPAPGDAVRLSGLAFAGVNHRRATAAGAEDGLLTAEEVASLDLHGVEWAVLSGCDTGVGEVQAGEGVLGLRRAFQVAGARTVIMSLWEVSDKATCQWMEGLYTERFTAGSSTAASVTRASLGVLEARRHRRQSTHPFYWGAFVAAGDWK